MRKQLPLCLGLLGCLAVVAGFAVWLLRPSSPGLTLENFSRLHEGMTEEEVVAILGEPTGRHNVCGQVRMIWRDRGQLAVVGFSRDGAGGGRFEVGEERIATLAGESLHVKVRRWLRL